jgi:polysaccharide biosynthesis/export protein
VMVNGSIRYHLIGQFTNPGLKFSDRPLRLLEVIALGGSIILDRASLRGAYVARGDKRLPINFRTLLREGDLKQNIAMRPGDVVFVPDDSNEVAFVFGAVAGGTARGGAIPFLNGQLEITQALAQAGYGFRERALGRLSRTRVIRSNGDQGELFTVNVAQILKGEAAPFPLMPGDVVFVPASAMATWNQALEQLLPTLQTVSGILTPFVQYKYLTDDDN